MFPIVLVNMYSKRSHTLSKMYCSNLCLSFYPQLSFLLFKFCLAFLFFFPYKLIFQVLILFEGNFNYLKWLNILPCSSFKMVTSLHWLNGTILWKKHVIISLNTEWSRDFIIVFMFLWFFFYFLFFNYFLSKAFQNWANERWWLSLRCHDEFVHRKIIIGY